ncbi:AraC family transcriptional regulator [Bordetella avium]|uniref:helix-turn-helix transcriptional regulator n=1 Tax=Bordetella avium TaxID=521 RepID=UPI000E1617E7|nr:AraC family transcriptional regulator [Bordetella avium]WQE32035.1 AraC family transcriptional regulator [Bordetella avium]SUV68878.1 enterobactin-dependent positive regulator [Bordetella avium]
MPPQTFAQAPNDGTLLRHPYLSALAESRACFEGLLETHQLGFGLTLQRVDWRDLQGVPMRGHEGPGLYLVLMLAGGTDLSAEGKLLMQALAGHGVIWGATARHEVQRQSRRGDIERGLILRISTSWLNERGCRVLRQLAQTHLEPRRWQLSRCSLARVQQVLHPPRQSADLLPLYLEARVLELLRESALALREERTAEPPLTQRKYLRMVQVRDLLESGQADDWPLARIAAEHHLSVNTLQRHFRAAWNSSIAEYRRDARLRRARAALEREGVSVADAAEIAGYSSPANFATAFRRAYGIAPRGVRT